MESIFERIGNEIYFTGLNMKEISERRITRAKPKIKINWYSFSYQFSYLLAYLLFDPKAGNVKENLVNQSATHGGNRCDVGSKTSREKSLCSHYLFSSSKW